MQTKRPTKKVLVQWAKLATEYLLSRGAVVKDTNYEDRMDGATPQFVIQTVIGPMYIVWYGDWVALWFENVVDAVKFMPQEVKRDALNPYSGKWNIDYFNDELDIDIRLTLLGDKLNRVLPKIAGADDLLKQAMNTPPVKYDEFVTNLSSEQRQQLSKQLDTACEYMALLRGYLDARGVNGCGDAGHDDAVNEANRVCAKVRKALGYNSTRKVYF